jgi:DNA polymerase-3 subunit alpha
MPDEQLHKRNHFMDKRFLEPAVLHCHSMYSVLDAVPSPEEWLEWCLKNGAPGLAITDHGYAISMFHAIRFRDMIKKYNKKNGTNYAEDSVIGIPGVELYVKSNATDKSHHHITCWATSNKGYFNLMKLASLAWNDTVSYFGSPKPRVTYDMIDQYSEGLSFGTGCIASPMGRAIMNGDYAAAEDIYKQYLEAFGGKLYVEFHSANLTHDFDKKTGSFVPIAANPLYPDGNAQKAYNHFLMDMVAKYGGKPIPATDAHFLYPEDKIVQDCLLKNGNDNGWYFHQSYHQKTADTIFEELKVHLGDRLTENMFVQWIANTHEVMNAAKDINVSFDYHLPKVEIPDYIAAKTQDYNLQTYYLLVEKVKLHGRWREDPVYIARFKKELDVIFKNDTLNFIPYFLMYEDACSHARSQGVFQNIARGSAGGALISYYLKIIHVDPIEKDLPFERFLSHARIRAGSFPDIDLDLSDRTLVLEYLKEKYGLGFAQVATYGKMKVKSAIKDAMWSLKGKNRNDPEVKAICDLIPDSPQGVDEFDFLYGYSDQEDIYHQGVVETVPPLATFFKMHPDVEGMVKKLIGVVRGLGRHASAFVISTVDLSSERLPTMLMSEDKLGNKITVTQYEASMVEKTGLVKADILKVTTLEAVKQCIDMVKELTGKDYHEENEYGIQEVYRLPEDPAIYTDLYNKKTDSSFQFNTSLIKGYVQQFVPVKRQDLSDFTALCRPGAMDAPLNGSTATQYYIDVRNGTRSLELLHQDMANYTTNGAIVYQEQIMAFLVDIVGYSLEEADTIRSAIAKKKHEVIMATFGRIRVACSARGWRDDQIETVCKQIQAFSRYSFNKSHSMAYSELGYITLYLKHYHPLEWWAATLNTVDKEDKLRHFVTVLGDTLSPPSLANTSNHFTIVKGKIVAPLSAIKGVGPASIEELCSKGPFLSLEDYCLRVLHTKVNAGHFAALTRARALDCLMDPEKPYLEARKDLLDRYVAIRRCKPFDAALWTLSPLDLFLQERAANEVFNRCVLDSPDVVAEIQSRWPGLVLTGRRSVPLRIGDVPILRGLDIAVGLLEKGVVEGKEFGFVLLYGGSEHRSGISKKNGRKWEMLKLDLSDGMMSVEGTMWDQVLPLRFTKDSLVYVRGTLQAGYKTPISITVSEIQSMKGI